MQQAPTPRRNAPRRSPAIWLGAVVAIIACSLPAMYRTQDDRRRVLAEEESRLSRAAERIEQLMRSKLNGVDADAYVAAFNETAEFAMPSGTGIAAALTSPDGVILARRPDPQGLVGKNVSSGQAFRAHRDSGGGQTTHIVVSASNNQPSMIVADNVAPPVLLFVTHNIEDILAAWRRRAMLETAQFACVAAAILIFAGMAARRENRLRQAAAAAGEREALYHDLFQGNKAMKLLLDPADGALVDVNAAACAFYGYDHATLLKMKISDINMMSRGEIAAEMADAQAERRSHFLFRHRLASGEIRDVEVHSGPVRYQGRELLYSIVHDVTERRRLEAERARLFTAIVQSPAAIVITNAEGTIEFVNPAFTRVSGYEPEEIIGQNPRVLKSGHTPDEEYKKMWSMLTNGVGYTTTFLNKKKDGSCYWEHAQISPVRDDKGVITNYVAVKENVTDLKNAEDSLREANIQLEIQTAKLLAVNSELEQFAYVASHDLRQPLRAISSYLQLIDKKFKDADPDTREFIGYAVAGARRMDQLIVGLLDYSRIGRTSRGFAPVAVADLVAVSRQTYAFAILDADATLTAAADLPIVHGDAAELQRLFDNLIGNAVKYRDHGRALAVAVGGAVADGWATLWVADNGVGMAPKDHERAFGMFQRLEKRDDCEGAGIGLAVCKKIVERHGGRIWIESVPDEGCRFLMTLPISADEGGDGSVVA